MTLGFLLLYRFPEAQLLKLATPFLLDGVDQGGLALSNQEVGLAYGTIGLVALTLGGLLGKAGKATVPAPSGVTAPAPCDDDGCAPRVVKAPVPRDGKELERIVGNLFRLDPDNGKVTAAATIRAAKAEAAARARIPSRRPVAAKPRCRGAAASGLCG